MQHCPSMFAVRMRLKKDAVLGRNNAFSAMPHQDKCDEKRGGWLGTVFPATSKYRSVVSIPSQAEHPMAVGSNYWTDCC